MAGAIQALKISELVNYYENPRHAIGSSEEDTLKKLFDAVGIQYMLNLAEDVQRNGLLGNQQVVVVYSETIHKYVVYEGNRRVAAIKLLLSLLLNTLAFWIGPLLKKQRRLGNKVKFLM